MRLFRHPPLLFWAVAVVVLAAIVFTAISVGGERTTTARLASAERPIVLSIGDRMPALWRLRAQPDAAALAAWGEATAAIASAGASERRASGATSSERVVIAYRDLADAAAALEDVDAANVEAVEAATLRVGRAYDTLAAITALPSSMPAPDAPPLPTTSSTMQLS